MSDERHPDYEPMREMDRWLRQAVIYGPIITFVIGWGSGVISAYLVFRDHERRIAVLEEAIKVQAQGIQSLLVGVSQISGFLDHKTGGH